jgi:hypothetical protein
MTRPRRGARPYHRSGEHIVAKAVPYLVQRVADPNIPDASLTPLERTVRGWRLEILQDLGGDAVRGHGRMGRKSLILKWRRGRDSNPRGLAPIPVFKTGAFNRSATPPVSAFRVLP